MSAGTRKSCTKTATRISGLTTAVCCMPWQPLSFCLQNPSVFKGVCLSLRKNTATGSPLLPNANINPKNEASMNFPTNVKYTNEHEWIRVEGGVAYVGITDYAQEQLGDIVFVDIPTEGETLEAGEVFGTIEVVKTISDLFMPVAGEVLEQNETLADKPELVNKAPYGEGWLIKVKPAVDADFGRLLDAEAYKALVNA